jgi:hypothetical protein
MASAANRAWLPDFTTKPISTANQVIKITTGNAITIQIVVTARAVR